MMFILGVDEVLYFPHGKFAHPKKTSTGGDLVSERPSDLGRGEWNAAVVELKQAQKVEEVALSSLGAKEPAMYS